MSGGVTLATTGLMVLSGIVIQLLINRSNRQGQVATNVIEGRKVDLDALVKTVERLDNEVDRLNDEVTNEREARIASDARAVAAEKRADKAETKVDSLTASLAAHGQWDLLVLAEVRKSNSDFPEPPPLAIPDDAA